LARVHWNHSEERFNQCSAQPLVAPRGITPRRLLYTHFT
jgi:hypothetical protein